MKIAKGCMGQHQVDQYLCYRDPKGEERKGQKAHEEIMVKNFPNLGK